RVRRIGGPPAQVVHAYAKGRLLDPGGGADGAQAVRFRLEPLRVHVGVKTGVQSDLVTARMNALHEVDDARVVGFVMPVATPVAAAAQEVESVAQPDFLGAIHDPVEGVERVAHVDST